MTQISSLLRGKSYPADTDESGVILMELIVSGLTTGRQMFSPYR